MSTIKTIVCNKCGKSEVDNDEKVRDGYQEIRFTFRKSEEESDEYSLDLCNECASGFLKSLKIEAEYWESDIWE